MDGVDKDQEVDLLGRQDRCRKGDLKRRRKKGRREEASLTRRSLD